MKFKILKGTALFDTLESVIEKMRACNAHAKALMSEFNADGYSKSRNGIAGGIAAFNFTDPTKKPQGWKAMERGYTNWFFPKAAEKDLISRISQLPIVETSAVSEPLNYQNQSWMNNERMVFSELPAIKFFDDYILVDVNSKAEYTPVSDMVEILESEYKELEKRTPKTL